MNEHDKLLEYISVKGSGELDDFREKCSDMNELWYKILYNLFSLGHLDYFKKTEGWSCSYPSLALTCFENKAVLCGARSDYLKNEINKFCKLEIVNNNMGGPEIWRVSSEISKMKRMSDQVGLNFHKEKTPTNLIKALPNINDYINRTSKKISLPNMNPKNLPEWYNPFTRKREKKKLINNNGLWLLHKIHSNEPIFIQKKGEDYFRVNDVYAVRFALDINLKELISYNPDHEKFIVEKAQEKIGNKNPKLKLPRLYSRVLCLCSGKLPKKDSKGRLIYEDVKPSVGRTVLVRLNGSAKFD